MKLRERRVVGKLLGLTAVIALAAAVLSACQSTQEPSAEWLPEAPEPGIEAAGVEQNTALRVRFQTPVGNSSPVVEPISSGMNLEIAIFVLDPDTLQASGGDLAPALSTSAGTITEVNGTYTAQWDVSQTAPGATGGYVRVEVRPAGVPKEQVCNDPWGACLGYFDARIVATGSGTNTPPSANVFLNVADHAIVPVTFKVLTGTNPIPENGLAGVLGMASEGDPLEESAGNCSSNEFYRPGQGLQAVGAGLQAVGAGLQAVGAVGGLFVADSDKVSGLVTSNHTVAAQLLAGMPAGNNKYYAAILVVDDFEPGSFGLPATLLDGTDLDVGDLDELLATGALSHGSLVLHQARQLAAAATGDSKAKSSAGGSTTEYKAAKGTRLLVQAVNARGMDTGDLADAIRAAVIALPDEYRRVVVNMSFAIVPCTVTEDFGVVMGTGSIPTFEEYVASLLEVNAIAPMYLDELGELVSLPVELADDPFFTYLACPLAVTANGQTRCDGKVGKNLPIVDSLVHVAASGNFGNEYALYPAALSTVISVGSLDVTPNGYAGQPSSFSNAATVLAPGALYQLAGKQTQQIVYAGTSFSAPVVSLFVALDQMRQPPSFGAGTLATYPITVHSMASTALTELPLVCTFTSGIPGSASAVDPTCD